MTYLTADQILAAADLPGDNVLVPEWGGTVRLRGLTGTERDHFEFRLATARKAGKEVSVRAEVVGRCMVDEAGDRVITDRQIEALGDKSGAVLDRLFDRVRELSGMGDDAAEEAAEDFGDDPDDGSPSG